MSFILKLLSILLQNKPHLNEPKPKEYSARFNTQKTYNLLFFPPAPIAPMHKSGKINGYRYLIRIVQWEVVELETTKR